MRLGSSGRAGPMPDPMPDPTGHKKREARRPPRRVLESDELRCNLDPWIIAIGIDEFRGSIGQLEMVDHSVPVCIAIVP